MRLFWWVATNFATIAACLIAATLWRERSIAADAGMRDTAQPAYVRRQHWRNKWWCFFWFAANLAVAFLGAALNWQAFHWTGPIPLFVPLGTCGFALIWVCIMGVAIWDWWAMGTVAAMRQRETAGC